MARRTFSDEFRRDAVELYLSTPGATVSGIASDLGITGPTLGVWLRAAGVEVAGRGRASRRPGAVRGPETPAEELVRLRARVADLEADRRKLNTERDILRAAAKYFAGETRW